MQVRKLTRLPKMNWKAVSEQLQNADLCICRFLYIVGIQSIRILKHLRRKLSVFFRPFINFCVRLYDASLGKELHWLKSEIDSIRQGIDTARRRIADARRGGALNAVKECFKVTGISFRLHKRFIFSVFSVITPVFCVMVLLFTVQYWKGLNYGLILENNGEQIAAIQNESVYEQATEMVNQRMMHDTADEEARLDFKPAFRLSVVKSGFAAAPYVCNQLIQQSNGIIEEASGLYVDGELLGVVKSGADLRYLVRSLLDAARGDSKDTVAQFVQNVEIENGLFPTTSIISTEEMQKIITSTSKTGVTYTVKQGDTVTSIAKSNHMTLSELNQINGNQLGDSIRPGDLVNIEVSEPKLQVELVQTKTYQVPIPYKTITQNDDSQYTDYTKVLTQGVNGVQECTDQIYMVNGAEIKRETMSEKVLTQAVDKVILTGTKKRPNNESGVSSGSFLWPVPSLHTITTYFTWRWGKFHTGIDISGANAYGKTIVAADGGTVAAAGWDGGYGNRVIIRHNGTFSTLYGHCSEILVSVGQNVSKGQAIAKIGSTGNSTGPHCHFEVIKNQEKVNPMQYVHN